MKKLLENQKNLQLVGAALVGAIASKVMHIEAIIALVLAIIVLVSFKDTKLKRWVERFIKAILIAIIVIVALVWHNIFCNNKGEVADEVAQQDEVVTEEAKVEDQPETTEEIVAEEETSEVVNSRI